MHSSAGSRVLRQFLSDSAIYGAATVLTRASQILLVPLLTRILAPRDYGAIDLLTVVATLANLTVALEISQAVARLYPDQDDPRERAAVASTALAFTVGTFGIVGCVALIFADPLSQLILGSAIPIDAFRIAVISIALSGVFYLAQNQLRFQLRPRVYASIAVVATTVSAGIGAVAALNGYGVVGVLFGQLVGNGPAPRSLSSPPGRHMPGASPAQHSSRCCVSRCPWFPRPSASLQPCQPTASALRVPRARRRRRLRRWLSNRIDRWPARADGTGGSHARSSTPTTAIRRLQRPSPRITRFVVGGLLLTSLGLALFAHELVAIAVGPAYAGGRGRVANPWHRPVRQPALRLCTGSGS